MGGGGHEEITRDLGKGERDRKRMNLEERKIIRGVRKKERERERCNRDERR